MSLQNNATPLAWKQSKYRELRHSKAFRFLAAADLMRFLDMRHDTDENSVIRAFVTWLLELLFEKWLRSRLAKKRKQ